MVRIVAFTVKKIICQFNCMFSCLLNSSPVEIKKNKALSLKNEWAYSRAGMNTSMPIHKDCGPRNYTRMCPYEGQNPCHTVYDTLCMSLSESIPEGSEFV